MYPDGNPNIMQHRPFRGAKLLYCEVVGNGSKETKRKEIKYEQNSYY